VIPVVVNGGEDPDDKIRALKAEMAAESKYVNAALPDTHSLSLSLCLLA
jgi:hypothetical protein